MTEKKMTEKKGAERGEKPKAKLDREQMKALRKELKEKGNLCAEYLADLKRLKAEFENYKKRIDRERMGFVNLATAGLVKQLLPILDDFERALTSAEGGKDQKLLEGLNLIYSHFKEALEKEGLREIEALGKEFDPNLHEAVLQVDAEKEHDDGQVVEVLRKGYVLRDQILRHAMVKVAKQT
jgi:molecular chaperone GrpE